MRRFTLTLDKQFSWRKLLLPGLTAGTFWTLAIVLYGVTGELFPLINFGYLGTALGIGLGLYAVLPKRQKPIGRRVSLLLIGLYLFIFVGLVGQENIQIEGVWWSLINGTFYAAVWHYVVAKIVGPLLFGRLWCGWACWSVMVFDLLSYKRPAGRLPGRWDWLRYGHVALSLALAWILWQVFGIQIGTNSGAAISWFLVGNGLYYVVGIGLAVALKDNRAFCKYVCPVAVPLKLTSRFSLLKVSTAAELCNDCKACEKVCPMDIQITDYVHAKQRVLSTECTLCQTCVTACAKDALKLSSGFDLGGKESLRLRPTAISIAEGVE
ncbi:4Fe-4S binding protein [Candidatus Leptofilum sp.]|uniref:4Fe-4S binding protein n=1 Tax=Candidatus Leptofilum sp. TaxID=3241576 RepID=UPI003B59383C